MSETTESKPSHVPKVHEVMDDDGELTAAALQVGVLELGAKLAKSF